MNQSFTIHNYDIIITLSNNYVIIKVFDTKNNIKMYQNKFDIILLKDLFQNKFETIQDFYNVIIAGLSDDKYVETYIYEYNNNIYIYTIYSYIIQFEFTIELYAKQ